MAASNYKSLTPKQIQTIGELKAAIEENTRKLSEVKKIRSCVQVEIIHSRRETQRRGELMMENSETVYALCHLGRLLQDEKHLLDQLNDKSSPDRIQISILEERSKNAKNKIRKLVAEIQEVKGHLAELKANKKAAQASAPIATSKSKRKQKKA